jgi:hypothetical protein
VCLCVGGWARGAGGVGGTVPGGLRRVFGSVCGGRGCPAKHSFHGVEVPAGGGLISSLVGGSAPVGEASFRPVHGLDHQEAAKAPLSMWLHSHWLGGLLVGREETQQIAERMITSSAISWRCLRGPATLQKLTHKPANKPPGTDSTTVTFPLASIRAGSMTTRRSGARVLVT